MATAITTIRKTTGQRLYIKEWMDHFDLSDEKVARRLSVGRETVWRWRTQQHRLNPIKILQLAQAIGVEPQDFWRPPTRPSLDAMLKDEPIDVLQKMADIIKVMTTKKSDEKVT